MSWPPSTPEHGRDPAGEALLTQRGLASLLGPSRWLEVISAHCIGLRERGEEDGGEAGMTLTARPPSGDVFEALASPHRRAILAMLAGSHLALWEIADRLPISRQAVTGHLDMLLSAGLVADEMAGTRRRFRLDEEGPAPVRKYLERVFGPGRRPRQRESKPGDPTAGAAATGVVAKRYPKQVAI